ncbi:MAG: murein biosynthesis integral membrane protein MurJ [Alphaproteobacteria bacterium]
MAHINRLFKPLMKVSSMTMLSRVLGFGRDITLSGLLGAGPVMDAFLIAFRFPNIFRSLFAEGAFSAAFVPLFVSLRKKSKNKKNIAIMFAGGVAIKLFLFLLALTILVMIFMPNIMWLIAPGFRDVPNGLAMLVNFGRISFPYLLAMSLAALFAGILQSHGYFWRGSFAASFLNISLITAIIFVVLVRGNYKQMMLDDRVGQVLCLAVILSGIWQAWYLWRGVKKIYPDYVSKVKLKTLWQHNIGQIMQKKYPPQEKKLLKTMTPAMLGAGGQQMNALVGDMIATTIGMGSVTHLFYADRLIQLPLGVIGIALGIVLLQRFASAHHSSYQNESRRMKKIQPLLQQGLCLGLAFGLPPMLALHFLSHNFIAFLFQRGAFDISAVDSTALALKIFALALPFYIINKVFQPYFYAKGDTKTPVRITLVSFFINGGLAFFLAKTMAEAGIATASLVAAAFVSLIFMTILFYHRIIPYSLSFWRPILWLLVINIPLLVFYYFLSLQTIPPLQMLATMPWGLSWGTPWLMVCLALLGTMVYYTPTMLLYQKYFHRRGGIGYKVIKKSVR